MRERDVPLCLDAVHARVPCGTHAIGPSELKDETNLTGHGLSVHACVPCGTAVVGPSEIKDETSLTAPFEHEPIVPLPKKPCCWVLVLFCLVENLALTARLVHCPLPFRVAVESGFEPVERVYCSFQRDIPAPRTTSLADPTVSLECAVPRSEPRNCQCTQEAIEVLVCITRKK